MFSTLSQFKQTLSDEIAAGSQRSVNDPISVIERNADTLRTQTPDVKDVMMESDGEGSRQGSPVSRNGQEESDNGGTSGNPTPGTTTLQNGETKEDQSTLDGDAQSATTADGVEDAKGETDNASKAKGKSSEDKTTEDKADAPVGSATPPRSTNSLGPAASVTSAKPAQEGLQHVKPSTSERKQDSGRSPEPETSISKAGEPSSRTSIDSQRPSSRGTPETTDGAASAANDPQLQAKLAKFARYEDKYPKLLKAYKQEKKKNELVLLYEKVLSEHTPCTSVAEPQELVNYLDGLVTKTDLQQSEIGKLGSELAKLRTELSEEKKKSTDLRRDMKAFKQKAEQQVAEARSQAEAQAEAQLRLDESAHLNEKIKALEQQLAESEAAGSVASRTQTTLRTQLDELGLRLAETQAELEILRDELADAERRSQERLQELSSLRNALRSRDKDRRRSTDEAEAQIAVLVAEKEQLEAEVEQLGRRIVRETEQLHVQLRSVRSQLHEAEAHAAGLQQELNRRSSRAEAATPLKMQPPSASDTAESHVPVALAQAEAAASGAVKANELLKQVNSDNALRIEKLQKAQRALAADLEQLRSENQQLRRRPTSTPTGTDADPADSEKQKAYLRNVILGFVEHRDQRKLLLPVLATLLGFSDGEEEKLLNSLK